MSALGPFVIVKVASTVLRPFSPHTQQLFAQLIEAKLYDSRYGEYDAGLLGLYHGRFHEAEMAAEAMWLAYRQGEPSRLVGVGVRMIGSRLEEATVQRFVLPECRGQGIGTALKSKLT